MTNKEFKVARNALGYTQNGLAREWGMGANGGRTIRRWESDDANYSINPVAAYCLQLMLKQQGCDNE